MIRWYWLFIPFCCGAQGIDDSLFIRRIYDEALTRGQAYERLRTLCKEVGHRLSGSEGADRAVAWGLANLREMGYDTAWLQPVYVPKWERGTLEKLKVSAAGKSIELSITALGMSVPTNGILEAPIVAVRNFEELETMGSNAIEGRIVFFYEPMDPRFIDTFFAYSGCGKYRLRGASRAAEMGAAGVVVRSLTHATDHHPHTGVVIYNDSFPKIPAAAVSTHDADQLLGWLQKKIPVTGFMELNCSLKEEALSYNVVGEIYGRQPNTFITIGGHLDSWDKGEGAHDDGAGVVHSMEALRILKTLGYQPGFTLRTVLFMNEENGTRGGSAYADSMRWRSEKHYAAIESDRGGFAPRGFSMDVNPRQMKQIEALTPLLLPYQLHLFYKGWSGVDIGPLRRDNPDALLMGFVTDSQRYFDFHHADTDVFEAVNERELTLGAAAMAAIVYLLDKYPVGQ
jgi:hypothetical protein